MISFKAATALKEAGFPQPDKAHGQTWYASNGIPWFVGCYLISDVPVMRSSTGTRWEWTYDTNGFVYAPTVVDILGQMSEYITDGKNILRVKGGIVESTVFGWESLEEAAALTWLSESYDPTIPKNGIYVGFAGTYTPTTHGKA